MRLLFELDSKDYNPNDNSHTRNSARAIILKDGKIAMIHSETDDFYKFPGGGIEKDEDPIQALIRETKEEAGLIVIPDSILEFGYVHIIQKGIQDGIFIQNNYYYICHTEEKTTSRNLDQYEAELDFKLVFVNPKIAAKANRAKMMQKSENVHICKIMLEREARVLEFIANELL